MGEAKRRRERLARSMPQMFDALVWHLERLEEYTSRGIGGEVGMVTEVAGSSASWSASLGQTRPCC